MQYSKPWSWSMGGWVISSGLMSAICPTLNTETEENEIQTGKKALIFINYIPLFFTSETEILIQTRRSQFAMSVKRKRLNLCAFFQCLSPQRRRNKLGFMQRIWRKRLNLWTLFSLLSNSLIDNFNVKRRTKLGFMLWIRSKTGKQPHRQPKPFRKLESLSFISSFHLSYWQSQRE